MSAASKYPSIAPPKLPRIIDENAPPRVGDRAGSLDSGEELPNGANQVLIPIPRFGTGNCGLALPLNCNDMDVFKLVVTLVCGMLFRGIQQLTTRVKAVQMRTCVQKGGRFRTSLGS